MSKFLEKVLREIEKIDYSVKYDLKGSVGKNKVICWGENDVLLDLCWE